MEYIITFTLSIKSELKYVMDKNIESLKFENQMNLSTVWMQSVYLSEPY